MTNLTDERLREIAAYQPLDFNITHLELISMAHELLALRKPVALSTRLKEAEKALTVFGAWTLETSTLGSLEKLDQMLAAEGIPLMKVGEWSAARSALKGEAS